MGWIIFAVVAVVAVVAFIVVSTLATVTFGQRNLGYIAMFIGTAGMFGLWKLCNITDRVETGIFIIGTLAANIVLYNGMIKDAPS